MFGLQVMERKYPCSDWQELANGIQYQVHWT